MALVAEAVKNSFSITYLSQIARIPTKRCITIWSRITAGSMTRALFITKPKTRPTAILTR